MEHLDSLSGLVQGAGWAIAAPKPASYGRMRMLSVFAEEIPTDVEVLFALEDAERWLGVAE